MIEPLPTLEEYGISADRGFLSPSPVFPLKHEYYKSWEDTIAKVQELLHQGEIRIAVDALPLLSAAHLVTLLEWKRAYFILVVLLQAYMWGGDEVSERIPPCITVPLLQVCEQVELPPVATYAALCLANYRPLSEDEPLSDLSNLSCAFTFTGTTDEAWFYQISMAIEAGGAPALPLMLEAIQAARQGDCYAVTQRLDAMAQILDVINCTLKRMYEKCDTQIFYHRMRKYLAGSKGMQYSGLPNGVWLDDGISAKNYRQFAGISNAQSSLIQFFDGVLGVEHRPTGIKPGAEPQATALVPSDGSVARHGFIHEMRTYMPGPHRRFLEHIDRVANIRSFVTARRSNLTLCAAYDSCLEELRRLRDLHFQIVYRYVIAESRRVQTGAESATDLTLTPKLLKLGKTKSKASEQASNQHRGTGGTELVPFLKQARDETTESRTSRLKSVAKKNSPRPKDQGDIGSKAGYVSHFGQAAQMWWLGGRGVNGKAKGFITPALLLSLVAMLVYSLS